MTANKDRSSNKNAETRRPPARTPEARENQLVDLAVTLAEKQLRDGTATSQVITHYLKLGSSREELEQTKIKTDIDLQQAKREQMASAAKVEELYETAIQAMRRYAGEDVSEEPPDED